MSEVPQSAETRGDQGSASTERERRPSNRRAGVAQLIIAGVTAVLLAIMGTVAWVTWPSAADGAAADLPDDGLGQWRPLADIESESLQLEWSKTLNEALAAGDREQFLSVATGQGAEALARWWDGTEQLGRTISFAQSFDDIDTMDEGEDPAFLMLGGQLSFASHPVRGSGSEDAGLQLTQNFTYKLTLEGTGDDAVISGLEPNGSPKPWDDGELYVVEREHVVLYGMHDERALVDANADLAESSAKLAFETLETIGGEAPIDGFVVAITDDDARFQRWFGADLEMDVAGFAGATERPRNSAFGDLPPDVATGSRSSGSLVAMGPKSASQRESTFVHEFAHVLHEAAVPYELSMPSSSAPTEGFAVYFEHVAGLEESYFARPEVGSAIAAEGEGAITDERLQSEDAWIAYAASGSFYQYVADAGGSPWQLALDRDRGFSMALRAKLQNEAFSEAGWQEWAASQ